MTTGSTTERDVVASTPKWVVSLAEDHITSMRMIFNEAAEKQSTLDAISLHRANGSFPPGIHRCIDVSVSLSMPVSASALDAAASITGRELERLLMRLATIRIDLKRSMSRTLDMMCATATRYGRPPTAMVEIDGWNAWFDRMLVAAIRVERRKMKHSRRTTKHHAVVRPDSEDRYRNGPMRANGCLPEAGDKVPS
jgi:hypothetical protein